MLELNHLALAPGAAKEEALLFERAQVDVFLVKAAAVGVRRGIASESNCCHGLCRPRVSGLVAGTCS